MAATTKQHLLSIGIETEPWQGLGKGRIPQAVPTELLELGGIAQSRTNYLWDCQRQAHATRSALAAHNINSI